MTLKDKFEFGTLVVKFMTGKISVSEEQMLDELLCENHDKLVLFENLIDENNQQWAREWFYRADVITQGIKWKTGKTWYRPETKSERDYFIILLAVLVYLAFVWFVLEYW